MEIFLPVGIEKNVDVVLFSCPFLEPDTRVLMIVVHCLHQYLALRRFWTPWKET
jgi:hypothetical protein